MEDKIKKIILEKIHPALKIDGGGIEYAGLEDNHVKVRLLDANQGCPSVQIILQMGILKMLQKELPQIKGIISV